MRRDRLIIWTIQFGLTAALFGGWWIASHSAGQRILLLPPPELVWTQMQFLWTSGRLASAGHCSRPLGEEPGSGSST